jgi:hypothetical protein
MATTVQPRTAKTAAMENASSGSDRDFRIGTAIIVMFFSAVVRQIL